MRAWNAAEKTGFFIFTRGIPAYYVKPAMKSRPITGAVRITGTAAYTLQRIVASPVEKLYTFTVSESVCREVGQVAADYFSAAADKEFASQAILDTL